MPYYVKPNKHRSVRWFYAILAIVAVGILYWSYVMHPVSAEVLAVPQTLPPDGKSFAEIKVVLLNRIDTEVPGQKARITCEVLTSPDLVDISYNEDKTLARVTAGTHEGVVEIKVYSSELVLPQTVKIYIEQPRA